MRTTDNDVTLHRCAAAAAHCRRVLLKAFAAAVSSRLYAFRMTAKVVLPVMQMTGTAVRRTACHFRLDLGNLNGNL